MDIDEAITQVRNAAAGVDEALAAVTAAKHALNRAALAAFLAADGDEEHERALVRRLYWDVPEVAVKTLEAVVGSAARVRELAGPGPRLGSCEDCGTVLHATSRTQLAAGASRCEPCDKRRLESPPPPPAMDWPRAHANGCCPDPLPDPPPEWDDEFPDVPPGW